MAIGINIIFVCAFYLELIPEWWTIFTRKDREPGRLVRKTLSFSKELRLLQAANTLEDAIYNFTRSVKTLRIELANPSKQARWQQRSPAMAAGLTDHIWTVQELLTVVLVPLCTNT